MTTETSARSVEPAVASQQPQPADQAPLWRRLHLLEEALLEYVARYGLTDAARQAMRPFPPWWTDEAASDERPLPPRP